MSKPLRYKVGDNILTDLEIREHAYKKADEMSPETKDAYLKGLGKYFDFKSTHAMKQFTTSGVIVPTIGLIILGVCVWLTFLTPNPTRFQSGVIWVCLCVGVGISAALIPGYFYYEKHPGFRAGGGLAFALIIYFVVPAIMHEDLSISKERVHLYTASSDTTTIQDFTVDFNREGEETLPVFLAAKYTEFMGQPCTEDSIYCFRKSDGKIFSNEKCSAFSTADIIIVHRRLAKLFGTPRDAYIHFFSKCD